MGAQLTVLRLLFSLPFLSLPLPQPFAPNTSGLDAALHVVAEQRFALGSRKEDLVKALQTLQRMSRKLLDNPGRDKYRVLNVSTPGFPKCLTCKRFLFARDDL